MVLALWTAISNLKSFKKITIFKLCIKSLFYMTEQHKILEMIKDN